MSKPKLVFAYICDFCGRSECDPGVYLCASPWRKLKHVAKAHICLECALAVVETLEELKAKHEQEGAKA